jgi:hypothetical protein
MLATALALLIAACGATPPQAPVSEAQRVSSALTGIAEACGEAYQQRPTYASERDLRQLLSAASMRALELERVVRKNPRWIYQSETLAAVASKAVDYLRECGLGKAAEILLRS